ncbi:recombinase family protein [Streptomyces goshikiensis]|uniref:recombinase family protein n=1 Tax=Streptomyces goshikiensis TaxID=1942 RepID=UPI0036B5ED46
MRSRFTEDDGVQKAPSRRRAAARRYRNQPCSITGRRFRQLLIRLGAEKGQGQTQEQHRGDRRRRHRHPGPPRGAHGRACGSPRRGAARTSRTRSWSAPSWKSGKNALPPEPKACHAFLDPGDTRVVPLLDRYGRSLQDLINTVAELRERGIGFTSLHENLDTTTPGGRLVFHVFAALAEFIRELIVIGTNEGLAAARAGATSADAPQSPPRKSSGPQATCCPASAAPSPRSPSCSASPRAPCTTTSRPTRTARQLEAPAK